MSTHNFISIGPTFADYRKVFSCSIWFKEPLTEEAKKYIEQQLPQILTSPIHPTWGKQFLHLETDDIFSYRVREEYGSFFRWGLFSKILGLLKSFAVRANRKELKLFYQNLNNVFRTIDSQYQIIFVMWPKGDMEDDENPVMNEYDVSLEVISKNIENIVVPVLLNFFTSKEQEKKDRYWVSLFTLSLFDYIPNPKDLTSSYRQKIRELVTYAKNSDEKVSVHFDDILTKL